MFKEATVYSPAIIEDGGGVSVVFSSDHPGYYDAEYQAHRAAIAEAALRFRPGNRVPDIPYTEAEHAIWRVVSAELAEKHRQHACRQYLIGRNLLPLPSDRLPQLSEVSTAVNRLTGFTFTPAAGLVEQEDFYGSLADQRFQATQYIRHSSFPRFSPEPDMIHEVVGHGTHLANQRLADLYRLVGETVRRLETRAAISLVSRVFWFAFEYGLVLEDGVTKVCGASLLSSCGELEQYQQADIRPMDIAAMACQKYLVQEFQPVLFRAESFSHFEDFLAGFLATIDDGSSLVTA